MCTPTAAGKILVWKRKAEEYLTASGMCCLALYAILKHSRVMAAGIRHSVHIRITVSAGLNYTIIHPGGLFDEEVRTGCRAVPAHCTFRPAMLPKPQAYASMCTLQNVFHVFMCL
jgi:hypothetical protein